MELPMYLEDKGFKIICLDCGSTNCEVKEEYDYDYFEELVYEGSYLVCNNCGQDNKI